MQEFTEWLAQQRRGDLSAELTQALAQVTQSVVANDKPGTLTLEIKVSPAGKHAELGTVMVVDDVRVKTPAAPRVGAIWFVDDEFSLQRHDPRQMRFRDPSEPQEASE